MPRDRTWFPATVSCLAFTVTVLARAAPPAAAAEAAVGSLWLPAIFADPEWNWQAMQRLVAAGNMTRFHQLFDEPYDRIPYPTKLPGGRLVIERRSGGAVREFALNLHGAEAVARYGGDSVRVVVLAQRKLPSSNLTSALPTF